eukprot:CAMPEP_0180803312 /NCGR_PEP_ID=MMETSP1038_2-20121128/60831_1 /TAXON_ID=632150 /ORGANISM="Azadinium spinosum, Strain 3D9" /LENGTH=98 /DNA_ID=CAMNT_0022843621 /DNA_START=13 /DNA_END=309 /DNA_ORIENTATION=+
MSEPARTCALWPACGVKLFVACTKFGIQGTAQGAVYEFPCVVETQRIHRRCQGLQESCISGKRQSISRQAQVLSGTVSSSTSHGIEKERAGLPSTKVL